MESLNIPKNVLDHIEEDIKSAEAELDDDAESIITNERYVYIAELIKGCCRKKSAGSLTVSDKIDKIVTNRWLALPIFAVVMIIVYYVSVTTVGTIATDWANDGVFGDGWHLLGIGTGAYEEAAEEYGGAVNAIDAFSLQYGVEAPDLETSDKAAVDSFAAQFNAGDTAVLITENEEDLSEEETVYTGEDLALAGAVLDKYSFSEPDPADYGIWIPGIPPLLENLLDKIGCAEWLKGLILDGIVAGVGAVLGFVPQMLILFIFLAFLESCGYMARIAFVMDRIFRKFGLSGKSFIPMLIGSGCGVPGIMASRTIENERDRRMTIMTTTFIPCGAKLPFIAMVAGAIFGGAWWVAPFAYLLGVCSIIVSGIILKKTKMFSGDPAPFVMELPAYHWPTFSNVMRSMWERGWSFIKKAGTIILLSTIAVWFTTYFGFIDGRFGMLTDEQVDHSILATIGGAIAWLFKPLGWGNWQAAVASITGLVAKENIVGTMGILYGGGEASVYSTMAATFTSASGLAFLVFNLLCAPCFAAIGAIRREMNSAKWTWFAIGYQTLFAYAIALIVNQFGLLFSGSANIIGLIFSVIIIAAMLFMLFKPYKEATKLDKKVKILAK